jgi:hypothetical protein
MDHTGIDWDLLTHDAKDWFTSLVSGSVMILLLMDRLIGPVLEIWIPADSRFWKLYSRVEKNNRGPGNVKKGMGPKEEGQWRRDC